MDVRSAQLQWSSGAHPSVKVAIISRDSNCVFKDQLIGSQLSSAISAFIETKLRGSLSAHDTGFRHLEVEQASLNTYGPGT